MQLKNREAVHALEEILRKLTGGTGLHTACYRFESSIGQVDGLLGAGVALPAELEKSPPKRQAEHLAGRWCAHTALDKLGIPAAAIAIGAGRAPVWPAGAVGAISHSASFAMALVGPGADYAGIGLDLEAIQAPVRARRLQQHVLDGAEIERGQDSGLGFAEWFTVAFSAKESLFKALYPITQQYFYFLDAQIEAIDAVQGTFSITLKRDLPPYYSTGDTFHGSLGMSPAWVVTALCVRH